MNNTHKKLFPEILLSRLPQLFHHIKQKTIIQLVEQPMACKRLRTVVGFMRATAKKYWDFGDHPLVMHFIGFHMVTYKIGVRSGI